MSNTRPSLDLLQKLVQEDEVGSLNTNSDVVDTKTHGSENGNQEEGRSEYSFDFFDDPSDTSCQKSSSPDLAKDEDSDDKEISGRSVTPVQAEENDEKKDLSKDDQKHDLKNERENETTPVKKNVRRKIRSFKKKRPLSKQTLSEKTEDDKTVFHEETKNSIPEQKTKTVKKRPKSGNRRQPVPKQTPYIDPDVCLEDNLYQKYKELDGILSGRFVEKTNITRSHLLQMDQLRTQYSQVSHGVLPNSLIIPRSLPSRFRGYRKTIHGFEEENECDLSDVSDDLAFQTIQSVMIAKTAKKEKKIRSDSSKKNERKEKDVTKINIPQKPSSIQRTDRLLTPSDTSLKNTSNPKIKQWLHKKNMLYRQQKATERRKFREKKQETELKMNEKTIKTEESNKAVEKWMAEKQKENVQKKKFEKENGRDRPKTTHQIEIHVSPNERNAAGIGRHAESDNDQKSESPEEIRERWKQQAIARQKIKVEGFGKETKQLPQQASKSKLVYKRPVAGRIKLRLPDKGKNTSEEKEKRVTTENVRMSYDDWLVQKRKDELSKKQEDSQRKQKQMRQSDPELVRVLPGLAKKRFEKKTDDKKHVDTGIQPTGSSDKGQDSVDSKVVKSEEKELQEEKKFSYKLTGTRETTSQEKSDPPTPKPSTQSPRKAIPAKVPVPNLETVMNNKFDTNPFKLPFPPEQGVPKHVANKQKQLFSGQIFNNLEVEERPEPQGCDSNHASPCGSTPTLSDASSLQIKSVKCDLEKQTPGEKASELDNRPVVENDAPRGVTKDEMTNLTREGTKSNKSSSRMGKRVSFSEETTVFEPSDYPNSDRSSPKEDVQFAEDLRSEDFNAAESLEIPSGTFLTSLD